MHVSVAHHTSVTCRYLVQQRNDVLDQVKGIAVYLYHIVSCLITHPPSQPGPQRRKKPNKALDALDSIIDLDLDRIDKIRPPREPRLGPNRHNIPELELPHELAIAGSLAATDFLEFGSGLDVLGVDAIVVTPYNTVLFHVTIGRGVGLD